MFKVNLLNAVAINVTNKFQMVECVVSVVTYVRLRSSVVNYLCIIENGMHRLTMEATSLTVVAAGSVPSG